MENMMARKKIKDLIEELRSWLPNYDSRGQNDYPVLLFRILASLPGGDELEDMGYETFQLGWHEADQLGRVLETIQDKSDVEDLVSGLVREEEEEEGMEEARRGRRPRSRSGARETATEEMRFTKDDDRVFKAFLNHRPAEGRKFSTDGRRLDGGAFLSNVASWETGPNGKETVVLHDLGSRTAQRIHRRLRKMGGPGIVKEDRASAREEAPRGDDGMIYGSGGLPGLRESRPRRRSRVREGSPISPRQVLDFLGPYMEHESLDAPKESARIARILNGAHGSRSVDNALEEVDKIIGGHGIEAIRGESYRGGYYGDIVGLYVNMGDTYNATVVYDTETGKFELTTWGDWVEQHQDEYEII